MLAAKFLFSKHLFCSLKLVLFDYCVSIRLCYDLSASFCDDSGAVLMEVLKSKSSLAIV